MSGCHNPDSLLHDLNHGLAKCFERVEKLEDKLEEESDNIEQHAEFINNIYKKINKLEREIQNMGTAISIKYDKKPHKCPVCEGMGGFLSTEPNMCPACDGKGIVWG